jgi:sugar/nucleoside kinase (ribokinase family)
MDNHTTDNQAAPIIAIGSGNIEHILTAEGAVRLGHKHAVDAVELLGGSCINYFLRLISAGFDTFPIPQIGRDDIGMRIQKGLIRIFRQLNLKTPLKNQMLDFISAPDFLVPGIKTSMAAIVVHDGLRTIFSQMHCGSDIAREHMLQRLSGLTALHQKRASLLIGHVPMDCQEGREGRVTRQILSMVPDDWFTMFNPGHRQYQLGVHFWEEALRKVDLIQLNLSEIKTFFDESGLPSALPRMIDYLGERSLSVVITLNKFGAIGMYRGDTDRMIITPPMPVIDLVDPTGAGDAFASGIVASLGGDKSFSFDALLSAIQTGRLWASYACTTLGASDGCPTRDQLHGFNRKIKQGENAQRVIDRSEAQKYFEMLEQMN